MLNLIIIILKLVRNHEKILAVERAKIEKLVDKKSSLVKQLARYQETIDGYQVKAKYYQSRAAHLNDKLIASEGGYRTRVLEDIQVSKKHLDEYQKDLYRAGNTIALVKQEIDRLCQDIQERENKVKKLKGQYT